MKRKPARLFHPENRLAALLSRAQGRSRAEAVRDGTLRLESQRGAAMTALEGLIAGLEQEAPARARLREIGRDADRIVTLALAFGLTPLADAAKRLCDMTALLAARNDCDAGALDVHVRALRLFAPGSPALDGAEAALLLGRIAALAAHLSAR